MYRSVVLCVGAAIFANFALAADKSTLERYNKSCKICHAKGLSTAPRTGDSVAWAKRMEKGEAVLVANVRKGFKGMPPMGMCTDCSDAEFVALIAFMAGDMQGSN